MPFIFLALRPKKHTKWPRHPIMEIGHDNKFKFYLHFMLGEKIIDSSLHSHTQVGRLLPNSKFRSAKLEQSWPTQVWTT
jgi:hypothetical protein